MLTRAPHRTHKVDFIFAFNAHLLVACHNFMTPTNMLSSETIGSYHDTFDTLIV